MKRIGLFMDRSKSCFRDVLEGVATFLDELPVSERWECWYASDLSNAELGPIPLDGALVTIAGEDVMEELRGVAPKMVGVLGCPSLEFEFPSVTCKDVEIGRMAARELLRRGHRDLAFVSNAVGERYDHVRDRVQGFREEVVAAGARFYLGPGTQKLAEFLLELPRPCGVMAMTDETGKFVLDTCRVHHIRVPQDLAVIGVDNDVTTCELCWPALATVQAGHFEVGYRAAARLHAMFNGGKDPAAPWVELVGTPEIVVRASVDSLAVEDEMVVEALRYITAHAHEDLSVGAICEGIGAGRRALELRFKRATGRSILAEIGFSRVRIAKRLLKNRALSLEQIARLSGFRTQTHFGVIFRRVVGTTPMAYRRQIAPSR